MLLDGQMLLIFILEFKIILVVGYLIGNILLIYILLVDNQIGYVIIIYIKILLWRINGYYISKINEVCFKNVKI